MLNLFIGIFVLSLLVFIHELGHFLAAKSLKIPVLAFSIGFGKPILKYKHGETEYRLCPIPFGGYVQMEGEEPGSADSGNGFASHPIWHRAIVALAGPVFNIVTAILFFWIMFYSGVPRESYLDNPTIGFITSTSPAKGVLEVGDSIIQINEYPIKTIDEAQRRLSDMNVHYSIIFSRNGLVDTQSITIDIPNGSEMLGFSPGIYGYQTVVAGEVFDNSPAQKAGLRQGDTIVSIDNTPVHHAYKVIATVLAYKEDSLHPNPISLSVRRAGKTLSFLVTPETHKRVKKNRFSKDDTTSYYRINMGFAGGETYKVTYSTTEALTRSITECQKVIVEMGSMLKKLFTRQLGISHMSGPLGIMQMSGAAARMGLPTLLYLMALLSLNLGILNLMPLVITDGGVLSLLLFEKLRGRPLSIEKQIKLSYVVMALFLLLFVTVTFYDIIRFPKLIF